MHPKALAWNKEHYPKLEGKTPKGLTLVPFDRPCDWCGEPVGIGWIHKPICLDKEREFYLDIFF